MCPQSGTFTVDEAKSMLSELLVGQLHHFLGFVQAPYHDGPKKELVNQAIAVFEERSSDVALRKKLRQLYAFRKPSVAVRFADLPLYKLIRVVHQPVLLIRSKGISEFESFKFAFTLHAEELALMTPTSGDSEGAAELHIRFCRLDASVPQEDSLPHTLHVHVNNHDATLRLLQKSSSFAEAGKVYVTPPSHMSSDRENAVQISWRDDILEDFAVQVNLVQKRPPIELLRIVKLRNVIPTATTKARIAELLDPNNSIVTESLRLSLKCPLGLSRIVDPCRGRSTCDGHLQCFDASTFLRMNHTKTDWKCPVCRRPINFKDLVCDEYFQEVLGSQISKDVDQVELNANGTFTPVGKPGTTQGIVEPKMARKGSKPDPPVVLISDDETDENDNSPLPVATTGVPFSVYKRAKLDTTRLE